MYKNSDREHTIINSYAEKKMDKKDILNSKKMQKVKEIHRLPYGITNDILPYGIKIIHSGSYTSEPDGFYSTPRRYFEYYSISHMYAGKGGLWFEEENREYNVSPGDCIVVTPGSVNRYGGIDGHPYCEDHICFSGPLADRLMEDGILKDGIYYMGDTRFIRPLFHFVADPARDSQMSAYILLLRTILDIYSRSQHMKELPGSAFDSRIEPVLVAIKQDISKWWTVEELAAQCSLSKDQFRRVFRKHTGILPKEYIDRMKLTKAASLLVSTNMKLPDIAESLSYHDYYHFSRRFKQVIGYPPKTYREVFRREGRRASDMNPEITMGEQNGGFNGEGR